MTCGRLDAQITVPVGGWSISVAITGAPGSPFVVTIPAGTYWSGSTLLSELQTQLDAASGADGPWSVTVNLSDEVGTGLINIKNDTHTFTITWTSTDLRDVLGFTATLTPAALSFSGTRHLRGVWLPDCVIDSEYGAEAGYTETDRSTLLSNGGDISVTAYGVERVRMGTTRWSMVTRPKARVSGETTVGASYEAWLLDTHSGRRSYFGTSPQVRVYHDSGGAVVATVRFLWDGSTRLVRSVPDWIYLWSIELPLAYGV